MPRALTAMQPPIDPRLEPFLFIAEVTRAERFVGPLFARKLGGTPPDFGHHMVAFYARGDGAFLPASYLHLWTQGTIGLVGGGCTDGGVIRAMRPEEQRLVTEAGGLLFQTLRFCFARFGPELEAFFGHCGDDRAKEVDLAAGFRETGVPHLLERHNRELSAERRAALLAQAQAIGDF
jgi:hypothetical protein